MYKTDCYFFRPSSYEIETGSDNHVQSIIYCGAYSSILYDKPFGDGCDSNCPYYINHTDALFISNKAIKEELNRRNEKNNKDPFVWMLEVCNSKEYEDLLDAGDPFIVAADKQLNKLTETIYDSKDLSNLIRYAMIMIDRYLSKQ